KRIGALENSSRGVWSLTDDGLLLDQLEVDRLYRRYLAETRRQRSATREPSAELELGDEEAEERSWKEELLEALLGLAPDRFERLARQLLREAGFISVDVTGRSGDGGIDGVGLYR